MILYKISKMRCKNMLLEFKMSNFKSFMDEMDFKMFAAPKQKDLAYSIMKEKFVEKYIKGYLLL